jgi:SAM-dependent methyltransferase
MKNHLFRLDEILKLCRNKSVLHLGYVQHSHLYDKLISEGSWVHSNIANVASEIAGIDYLEDDVKIIREKYNYEGYAGDANHLENVKLDRTFDVIVCGELIEHITNPGLMLDGVKRFMHPGSILIVTTPNKWSSYYFQLSRKKTNEESWINPEHSCWYSHFTLKNTLGKHGFAEVRYDYYFGFETKQRYLIVSSGIRGFFGRLKRKWLMTFTRQQNQLGLFFVATKFA